ncbi:cytochrome P450 monooxygenase [Fusarium pseudoanthophilum]|uniref:Cytochrome P450 monooxygenase n=1 Tax=Fusarium pseudoanthophilum TaxID=48495 RepID=A0A8H5P6R2_9HYPO|nr:cytochrome P450 monooxygenase [Fusarium pseudoanthophilum]
MSLMLTPTKTEAWFRLKGKSSARELALYGSSVLGALLTLYWAGLVIYHIYLYSLASYLDPLLQISTPGRALLLVMYLEAIVLNFGRIWRIVRSTQGRIRFAIDKNHEAYSGS